MRRKRANALAPLLLDLGPHSVVVNVVPEHIGGHRLGEYDNDNHVITLSAKQSPSNLLETLWHEVLHDLDASLLGERLAGMDGAGDRHPTLDALSNCIHMVLARNWPAMRVLYDNLARGPAG